MGALTVTTLGAARIFHNAVECAISMRKVLALAIYLAVTGQPQPRSHLVTLLWPDADAAHGLLNLRQTLLRLRQALGDDAETHLRATGDLALLDLGTDGMLDVTRLLAAAALHALPAQRMVALESYEGDFLAHLVIDDAPDFMDWVSAQRIHWSECFDLVAERHIKWLIDSGQLDEAITLGERWISLRPDSETSYRLLATAQVTGGDLAGARLTLATGTRRWEELGLETSAETSTLLRGLEAYQARASTAAPGRMMRLPFVGRDTAFADLRQAFGQLQEGMPGVALVQGEAGLGKSRLLRTFARWARVQGADVALGRADELSGRLPYQPLMELLRMQLVRENAPDDLLEDSWLIELQRLVPDLHDRYPDLPAPIDDTAAGVRMLEAVAQLGLALARRRPLLWLIDDLHWADEATRDALLYLAKRWQDAQAPTLIVGSMRSEELATVPALEDWVAAMQRATALTKIALTPLSVEQATRAVTTILAESNRAEVCAWLQETTQGNPLYLVHVLQAMVERGAIQWQEGEKGEVPRLAANVEVAALIGWLPETLRGVLLRRIKRLDSTAQQTLAAAAVLGARFSEGVLAPVAGVDEDTVLAVLELAERRILIRPEAGRYRFTHDLVAEAVYSDLSLARRRAFHRRALRALEAMEGTPPSELARHALGAEDWEAAARYGQRAAEAAERFGAHHDAVRFYEQAVQLLTTAPSREALRPHVTDEAQFDLYSSLGLLYARLGDHSRARALYQALLREAQLRGTWLLEGRALYLLGREASAYKRDVPTAQRYQNEAQRIAREHGDVLGLLLTDIQLASIAMYHGDIVLAGEYRQHVVQLARTSGDHLRLAEGLNEISDVHKLLGDWEAASAACEESLVIFARLADKAMGVEPSITLAEEPPSPYPFTPALAWTTFGPKIAPLLRQDLSRGIANMRRWAANALMGMGNSRLHLGEGEVGRAALAMGWRIFNEQNEQRFYHAYLLHWTLGWMEAGEYEHALRESQQVMEAMTTAVDRPVDPTNCKPYCALVDAHQAFFQLEQARQFLERASAFASDKPVWEQLLPASRWCTHHALAGDWAAAAAAARKAQALRDRMPTPLTWFDFARHFETEALLRTGDRTQAQTDVQHLGEHIGTKRRYRLMYLRMQALLDRDADEGSTASVHLLQALDLATQLGLPGEEWQIAAELAVTYASIGDTARSTEARQQAERVVASLAERITDLSLRNRFSRIALAWYPARD